jgi:hypothetical protein
VDIEITPSVSFELGQENNNTMDAKSYGKLTVKLPLGNKQKFTNFAIASKAFKDSSKMDLGELAWVERNNKIKNSTILFYGLTYSLVTSPKSACWANVIDSAIFPSSYSEPATLIDTTFCPVTRGMFWVWILSLPRQ